MPTAALEAVTNSPKIPVKTLHPAWADVGISPYNYMSRYIRIRRKSP